MSIAAWLGNLAGVQAARITVQGGYGPAAVFVAKGKPVRLDFTRREASPCSELVIFDGVDRRAELPENETVSVEFTPRRTGLINFGCHRGTLRGHFEFEPPIPTGLVRLLPFALRGAAGKGGRILRCSRERYSSSGSRERQGQPQRLA